MDLFRAFSKPSSKDIAKERLRLILINDRCSMPQEVLEDIKEDILKVLSKYMEINYAEIEACIVKALNYLAGSVQNGLKNAGINGK